jgi:hypothetical protein
MRTLLLAFPILALGACSVGLAGSSTPEIVFTGCANTCAADDWKLAAGGAHATAHLTGGLPTTVRSSDPSIVTAVTHDKPDADIELFTGAPGTATIEALDDRGHTLATATAVVEPTAVLEIQRPSGGSTVPLLLEGTPQILTTVTQDANRHVTRGDGSVEFTLSGTLSDAYLPLVGDAIAVVGKPGSGTITATCPDANAQQAVTVVPASAITGLLATTTPEPDGTVVVGVVPTSDQGMVYAGNCDWSGMAPTVTLQQQLASTLSLGPGTLSIFTLTRPGSFDVTCTLAGKTATVTLTR